VGLCGGLGCVCCTRHNVYGGEVVCCQENMLQLLRQAGRVPRVQALPAMAQTRVCPPQVSRPSAQSRPACCRACFVELQAGER